MDISQKLAAERRARLVAERRLEHVQAELRDARDRIAAQARTLAEQLVEQRHGLEAALSEAASLKGEKHRALADLERATAAVQIAQRRLWNALETIRDGFAIFDSDLALVAANRSFISFFTPQVAITRGLHYDDLITRCAEAGLVVPVDETPSDWVARMQARIRQPQPDNLVLSVASGRSLRLTDRRGDGGDIVSLVTDITKSIRREVALNEARLKAEAASRTKSAFLANMSHEIRTPMNGIVGMAELLAETCLDNDQRLYADTIRSSGDALLSIINDILDFSKAEADRLRLYSEPFDLSDCVQAVTTLLQSTARDNGIALSADYDTQLPRRFSGDQKRLRQILTNLLGNAVKFTAQGHVILRVLGHQEGDLWALTIMIEDSGIGIAPEHQSMIFGEFDQVENETSRQYQGTGLGLSIVRELARLMDGDVQVDSALGMGATFTLSLSLPAHDTPAENPPLPPRQMRRAVIIDCNPARSVAIAAMLSNWGISTTRLNPSAPDSQAAAPLSATPDLVVIAPPRGAIRIPPDHLALMPENAAETPVILIGPDTGSADQTDATLRLLARLEGPVTCADLRLALNATPPELPAPSPQPVPPCAAPPPVPRRRVLAADDNRTNLLVFRKMVESAGIELITAADGREAIAQWQATRPDLIFMDVSMPVLDGIEATHRIRQIETREGLPRTPIYALTAHPTDEIGPDLDRAGADGALSKPFRRAEILALIDTPVPVSSAAAGG